MNDSYLHTYLNDHLAIMKGEVALARRSAASNRGTTGGDFLHRLQNDIRAQCSIVTDLLHRTRGREDRVKQSTIWIAEKLGRFKRNGSLVNFSNLSRVVELETLGATAQERVAMWDSLDLIGDSDKRMDGTIFQFFSRAVSATRPGTR